VDRGPRGGGVSTDLLLHEGSIILGVGDGRLLRVDPADGTLLGETDLSANHRTAPRTIKAVGGKIYIGAFVGTLLAYRW